MANDKIIRIRSDIASAIQDAQKLKQAYASISGANSALSSTANSLEAMAEAARQARNDLTSANDNTRDLTDSMSDLSSAAEEARDALEDTSSGADDVADSSSRAAAENDRLASSFDTLAGKLKAAVAGYLSFQAVAQVGGIADQWSDMQSMIGAATKDMENAPKVMAEMVRLANLSYSPLEMTAEAFGRNVSVMRELGYSTQSTIDYTEALNHALVITATRGEKAASVQNALGKAMATGNLDSEGVQTILANGGRIAEALAQQLGTTSAGLLKMASDGKITANVISTALIGSLQQLRVEAGEMPATMADGMTRLSNNFQQLVGNLDATYSISSTVATALLTVADHLDDVADVVFLAATAFVAYKASALLVTGVNAAMAAGMSGLAASAGTAATSMAALTASMLTNPALWLTAGLTGLVFGLKSASDASREAEATILSSAQALREMGVELNAAETAALNAGTETDILGGSMTASENAAWSYKNATDNLTKSQWELATASRAARVQMLQQQLTESRAKELEHARYGKGAAIDKYNLGRAQIRDGDWAGGVQNVGGAILDATTRTFMGRDQLKANEAAALSAARLSIQLQKDINEAKNTALGASDVPRPVGGGGGKPNPKPTGGGERNSAASEAEQLAKRQKEYWDALNESVVSAGLLRSEVELHTKELELQKILGRDLNEQEQKDIKSKLNAARDLKAITALRQLGVDTEIEIGLEKTRQLGLSTALQGVEDQLFDMRKTAALQGVDITSEHYLLEEAKTREQLKQNALMKEGNAIRRAGFADEKAFLEGTSLGLSRSERDRAARDEQYGKARAEILHGSNGLSDAERAAKLERLDRAREEKERAAQAQILDEKIRGWSDAIHGLADLFGGRLGGVLGDFADGMSAIAETLNGGGPLGSLAEQLGLGDSFKRGAKSVFGDLKGLFGDTFKGLKIDIGEALGKAQAGAQIGGMVNSGMSALGIKTSKTGAQIGGAIGSAIPIPGGTIIGSILGGLIGGLFKKAKWGTAVMGGEGDPIISGRGGAQKKAASGAAGSVMEGLSALAAELGGTVGSFQTSIGTYKDNWRVSTTGYSGKLNFKGNTGPSGKGLHDFGDDAAAAIQFAIEDAISDGAIKGLAPLIQKALSALTTDAAIQFARDWKSAMNDYDALLDPITAAAKSIIEPFKALRDTMVEIGAATEDLTKIDDYRTLRLKNALKEQLASLTDFLDALKGENSGVSKIERLNSKMLEFDVMREAIAGGDSSIDQSAFTKLGQEIFGLAGDIYGTATSQFQSIRQTLLDTTTDFANNVTADFNAAAGQTVATSIDHTTTAIQNQTAAQAAHYRAVQEQAALQTAWLKKIAEGQAVAGQTVATAGSQAVNGQYHGQYY